MPPACVFLLGWLSARYDPCRFNAMECYTMLAAPVLTQMAVRQVQRMLFQRFLSVLQC